MEEDKVKEILKRFRESRRIINAHAYNESMPLSKRRENIEIEEDRFCEEICQLFEKPNLESVLQFIESYFVTTVEAGAEVHHIDDTEWQSVRSRCFKITEKPEIELKGQRCKDLSDYPQIIKIRSTEKPSQIDTLKLSHELNMQYGIPKVEKPKLKLPTNPYGDFVMEPQHLRGLREGFSQSLEQVREFSS